MKVSLAYATFETQAWHTFEVPEEATVEEIIKVSGFLDLFPEIDLKKQKVGIYGKFTRLNAKVSPGDRIEVYQPITRVLEEDDDDDDE